MDAAWQESKKLQAVYEAILVSDLARPEYKGSSIIEYFEYFLLGRKLWCRQVALIVEAFSAGLARKSNIGTYRVELVQYSAAQCSTLCCQPIAYLRLDLVAFVLTCYHDRVLVNEC